MEDARRELGVRFFRFVSLLKAADQVRFFWGSKDQDIIGLYLRQHNMLARARHNMLVLIRHNTLVNSRDAVEVS